MKAGGTEPKAKGDKPSAEGPLYDRLRAASIRLFWLGLVMLLLGMAAILSFAVSVESAALVIGWAFLVSGGLIFLGSFAIHGTGPVFGALLLGVISIATSAFLLLNPLADAVELRLVVGVIFVIQGAFELTLALEVRPNGGWEGMLISGLASVAMAMVLAAGWPQVPVSALRILLGLNFLSSGLGYIYLFNMVTANTVIPSRWQLEQRSKRSRNEASPAKVPPRK